MATFDVIKCCQESIRQISDSIDDAVIYLDAGSTESFQFIGAFPLFLELGARAVCSLENMSSLDKVIGWGSNCGHVMKIVVITSRLLSDAHRYILRCLNLLQGVIHCAIYTSISEVAHSAYPDSPLGPDAFLEYETLLKQDYEELVKKQLADRSSHTNSDIGIDESNAFEDEGWSHLTSLDDDIAGYDSASIKRSIQEDNPGSGGVVQLELMISVHHFPLLICPLSPKVFVLPSEGSIVEASISTENENSISSGLPPLSTGKSADSDDLIPGATLTAQFLYHLALKIDLKLEIFSLGDMSKHIGKLLADMSSLYDVARRKRSVGLLIIDRTLDLLTPCCHGDSLIDRMFSNLPRKQRKSNVSQMKGSQNILKKGSVKLERSPISVKIPLENVILQDDSKSDIKLLKSIDAFTNGWNSMVKGSEQLNDESFSGCDELNGTFVCTDNFRGAPYLEAIMERRTKDAVMLIKKWLQESLRSEKISLDVRVRPGFPSKSELLSLVKLLAKKQSSLLKYKGIIQLASATAYILDELNTTKWDAFISAEKSLRANAVDACQTLSSQISDFITRTASVASQVPKQNRLEKSQGIFTLDDALLLTIVGYMLAGESFPNSGSGGPFSWQEEHFMKEALIDAILENPTVSKLKFLQGFSDELQYKLEMPKSDDKKVSSNRLDQDYDDDDQWDSWGDEDDEKDPKKEEAFGDMQLKLELRDRVDNLFKFLHKLSSIKRNASLKEGFSTLDSRWNDDINSSKGLLYKLLTNILDKHDITGLENHSSTVGRLFKSGFGRLGLGQAKPSLSDQNVILIFVIGGISGVEVQEAMEAVAASNRPDIDLVLGGTTFLTPNDMFELLLGDYSHI